MKARVDKGSRKKVLFYFPEAIFLVKIKIIITQAFCTRDGFKNILLGSNGAAMKGDVSER